MVRLFIDQGIMACEHYLFCELVYLFHA